MTDGRANTVRSRYQATSPAFEFSTYESDHIDVLFGEGCLNIMLHGKKVFHDFLAYIIRKMQREKVMHQSK